MSLVLKNLDEVGILTLTLNRPERLNAYTSELYDELIAAFDYADATDEVRAIIVTGAGRGFCAGADLSSQGATFDYASAMKDIENSPINDDGSVDFNNPATRDTGGALTCRIFELTKPIIAAVNGPAFGVGATMTYAMDIRIMSEEASFGMPFTRIGIIPEGASNWFLPRLVGISKALEWAMGAAKISPGEALDAGLVRSVHKPDDLLEAAREIALSFIHNRAPVSVALTRQMMWNMLGASHPIEANRLESQAVWHQGVNGDAEEGVTAFAEKRDASFPNAVPKNMPHFSPWMDKKDYCE